MPATESTQHGADRVADLITAIRRSPSMRPTTIPTTFRGSHGTVRRRDTATHWIHWYPAKMFHRIPAEILSASPSPHLTVLDPFCGSGTVLLEAALRGHRAIGIDVNPLARLISRVKTTRLDVRSLSERATYVSRQAQAAGSIPGPDRLPAYWFLPGARLALVRTHRAIQEISYLPHRNFLRISLSAIVRRSSLADPSVPPPVRLSEKRAQRASTRYRRHLERALAVTPRTVYEAFSARVQSNIMRMSALSNVSGYGHARILNDPAEAAMTGLPTQSVDLVITSPPYCGAQKYVRSLKLEMLLLGFRHSQIATVDRRTLGTERITIRQARTRLQTPFSDANSLIQAISEVNLTRALMVAEYVRYLNKFTKECARVLKDGGEAFVTFGTAHVAGMPVAWDALFRVLAAHAGLTVVAVFVDSIPSRGLLTSRHRTSGTIDDERVVWVRKPR